MTTTTTTTTTSSRYIGPASNTGNAPTFGILSLTRPVLTQWTNGMPPPGEKKGLWVRLSVSGQLKPDTAMGTDCYEAGCEVYEVGNNKPLVSKTRMKATATGTDSWDLECQINGDPGSSIDFTGMTLFVEVTATIIIETQDGPTAVAGEFNTLGTSPFVQGWEPCTS